MPRLNSILLLPLFIPLLTVSSCFTMSSNKELWHAARNPPDDPKDLGCSFKDKAVLVTGAHGPGLGANAAIKHATLGRTRFFLPLERKKKVSMPKQKLSGELEALRICSLSNLLTCRASNQSRILSSDSAGALPRCMLCNSPVASRLSHVPRQTMATRYLYK